jgi:ribonuclease VapC
MDGLRLRHRPIQIKVLAEEPKASEIVQSLKSHGGPFAVPPMTVFESTLGLARARVARNHAVTSEDLATALASIVKFCEALQAEEPPVTPYLARRAVEAAARFGKIVGHRADLNFRDCFAYAHAQARGESLMFVGNGFTHTDVPSALLNPRPLR